MAMTEEKKKGPGFFNIQVLLITITYDPGVMSGVRRKRCTVSNTQEAGLPTEIALNTHNASLTTSQTHHPEPTHHELGCESVQVRGCGNGTQKKGEHWKKCSLKVYSLHPIGKA